MSILTLSFNEPDSDTGGYQVSYRPKGSTQSYYIVNSTVVPINISTNIITNVDYEGYIQGICDGKVSKGKPFATSKYNNATGSVSIADCNSSFNGSVSSVKFKSIQFLPLIQGITLSEGVQQDFISNAQGTGDLVITHSFTRCHITIADSSGVVQEQTGVTTSPVTFHNVIINATKVFSVQITCEPLPV